MITPFAERMSERRFDALSVVMTSLSRGSDIQDEKLELEQSAEYRFLLILQGNPLLLANGRKRFGEPGTCMLIAPEERVQLIRNGSPYSLGLINFKGVSDDPDPRLDQELLERIPKSVVVPLHVLQFLVDEQQRENDLSSVWAELNRQQRFLSFLTELLKPQRADKALLFDIKNKVQDTISHIEQNYASELSVQDLADRAELPRWHYLRVFKQLTGHTPSGYITQVRIEQAKSLLLQSEGKVWEVAHQVGYPDEQYFNRRFKQQTGNAPGEYARLHNAVFHVNDWQGNRCKVPVASKRIIYDDASTLGDLLVLGVAPIGANLRHYAITQQLQETKEIGFPLNMNTVRELRPDLVLLSRYGYEHFESIAEISSIVGLNEYAPMERRLHKLGEILDMRDEAQAWIQLYDERRTEMWERLQSRKAKGETAAILFYAKSGAVYVMHRRRGIAKLLYHPLGFEKDEKFKRLRPRKGEYYIALDPESIAETLIADRLFVFYQSGFTAEKVQTELQNLADWQTLPAVRADRVHYMHERWNGEDALSSMRLIEHFPDLWD
ncbi:helix-turn-helix domain-containing protein [Saccharibacillus sacchari]|uniref:Helix-turn-helix domain-containing protein n=1 Tax=Saccharibacillus sacchari TaxID=456493 RepID=A0ACC6PIZ7_9BACL